MLIARWKFWGYGIFDGNQKLAHAYLSWWGAGGRLVVQGKQYRIVPKGFPLHNRYELRRGRTCEAIAKLQWLPLPPVRTLEYGGQVYVAKNGLITQNDQTMGAYRARRSGNWLWSSIEFDLPQQLPLIPKLFFAWMLLSANRLAD